MVSLRFSLAALAAVFTASAFAAQPEATLPPGFTLEVAAAPPLVQHPIMAALGEPGVLFLGDAAGENMNKADLEKNLPNRVLQLRDTDGDGKYDKVTVFADKMTFPQGAQWLAGSLYVMSPPGLWKLTDTDGDGVADQREMLVGGFEYTGNAADVHGPFLHPNGRLYWCHGRKGHKVTQKDGTLVHEGLASGIWSCRPDGSDVRWHSLGCGDNPVEVDFTPEGEIVGVQNIFYTNPRGDTIVHWLRGGIYPRPDQLKAIEGLPRTLDTMPVVHNFGHVGVSGSAFYRSGALDPAWRGSFFVSHFNTQRLTRMEMLPDGATYRVTEREFLKLHDPDIHLTDVLEDRDGSLLVLNTGGWFRIGCPSSLMAKPDIAGAVYRIRKTGAAEKVEPWGTSAAAVWQMLARQDTAGLIAALSSPDASVAHAAGNALAQLPTADAVHALIAAWQRPEPGVQLAAAHALGERAALPPAAATALLARLGGPLDPAVEHQAMFALLKSAPEPLLAALRESSQHPTLQRRALTVLDQMPGSPHLTAALVLPLLDSPDPDLARKASQIASRHDDWDVAAHFAEWLKAPRISLAHLATIELIAPTRLKQPAMAEVVTRLTTAAPTTAWKIIAAGDATPSAAAWSDALIAALGTSTPADLPLVLAAATKVSTPALRARLREFSDDPKQPLAFRLKAVAVALDRSKPLPAESFDLLKRSLQDASTSARTEAARTLAGAKLDKDQTLALVPILSTLGPIETRELIKGFPRWFGPATTLPLALALKNSVALASFQESELRTVFSSVPDAFAELQPALHALAAADTERRQLLETLPPRIAREGRPAEGRKLFESGIGACIGCHRIGEVGNLVGPNLSTIGRIRVERDLLESILFPSNSLARDYEAHAIETSDGQSLIGVVRGSLPDVLIVADAGAQEHRIPHQTITANTTLPTSLMPTGLDKTLTEQQLIDLVAYLRSRQ